MTKKPELPGAGHKWLDWSPSAKEEIEAYGEAMAAWAREQALEPLIDRLVILHIYRKEHDTDIALALHDLITWEIQTALDPKVSSAAAALIKAGRESMREECRKAVKSAEELDGEMPDEIFAYITGSKEQATQTQRAVVRATKGEILDYINWISL